MATEETPVTTDLEACLVRHEREPDPGYALMVDGPWGVGKTHQVREILGSHGIRYVYLSLAGVATVAELNSAIFVACRPRSSRITNGGTWVASHWPDGLVGKYARVSADVISALVRINVKPDCLLVVDDLERCTIDIRDLVGVLNDLIEHKESRVVLIGHSKEIQSPEKGKGFNEIREKIIGRTVLAQPNVDGALASFLDALYSRGRSGEVLRKQAQVFRDVFAASRYASLRVLRFAVQDCATYLSCWRHDQLQHEKAVSDALREFLPFCLTHHHKPLPNGFLAQMTGPYMGLARSMRHLRYLRSAGTPEEPSENDAMGRDLLDRFGTLPFSADMIAGELLEDMIVRGRFDASAIRARLDQVPPFARPEDMPPWQAIIHFRRLEPTVTQGAIGALRTGLRGLGYTEPGEILHTTAARLYLATLDELSESKAEVVEEACRHVDALAHAGTLQVAAAGPDDLDEQQGEYLDISYPVEDSYATEFEAVRTHLMDVRSERLKASYESIGNATMDALRRDGLNLSTPVLGTIEEIRTLDLRPVLQAVDPDRFVRAWLESPAPTWLSTLAWIDRRYSPGRLQQIKGMRYERAFVIGVVECLGREADARRGLERQRVQGIVPDITVFDLPEPEPDGD